MRSMRNNFASFGRGGPWSALVGSASAAPINLLVFALLCVGSGPVFAADIDVSGGGWWHSRELKRTVELLVRPEQNPTLEAGAIEDAALILISEMQSDGYLRPKVKAQLERTGGEKQEFIWDESLATFLPRPLEAAKVDYHLEPGVRYLVSKVVIEGLNALSLSEGEAYFRSENYLVPQASNRIYTPQRFERAQANLQEELRQRGYANARVEGQVTARDDKTGDIDLKVVVVQGPRWEIDTVVLAEPVEPAPAPELLERQKGRPYSTIWEQGFAERVRSFYHQRGYMDVKVELSMQAGVPTAANDPTQAPVRIGLTVKPGQRVLAGPVRFAGADVVKQSVLMRQSHVREGEPLNPEKVNDTRENLIRLGVFRTVDLGYEPVDGPVRSPVFNLTPGREQDFNLLAGWGSYERLRGGLEYRHYNVFNLAHQVRADLVQSMKSSRGEVNYLVPDLFGESIDGTATLFGLRREERSFRREEYGGSVGAKRHIRELGGDVSATYTYQSLRTVNSSLETDPRDLISAKVASIDLTFLRDRQDNPLRPRRGYRLFVRTEFAAKILGGEVDYQRIEVGGTWHWRVGRGRWIHAGASHGAVTTYGGDGDSLPVNKRFFPGGENTVRGYSEGEAVPRSADGTFIGAKSYLLLNLEFEQALTRNWSLVAFSDTIGIADRLADYPMHQMLSSVGLGIRYHSLIGPIRLEYGHNLNPREFDPSGTVHFSVGFPF